MSSMADAPKRGACDRCRAVKRKCTNELGACSRCLSLGVVCSYSNSRPRGRPKKNDNEASEQTGSDKHMVSESSPIDTHVPGSSAPGFGFQGQSQQQFSYTHDYGLVDARDAPIEDFSGPLHNCAQIDDCLQTPSGFSAKKENVDLSIPACTCLLDIYQMLDVVRRGTEATFPSSFRILRDAVRTATAVVDCQVCPTQYVSATQNALLLCTLVISVAHCFRNIASHIVSEEGRSIEANEMKKMRIGEYTGETSDDDTFAFETTPSEWKSIALKALKAEIFGISGQTHPYFIALVEKLEKRQILWHAYPPCEDVPASYRITSGKPSCLKLINEAGHIVRRLNLE